MKKNLSILLLTLMSLVLLVGCSGGNMKEATLDGILESGTLIVGTSADYPPYEFHALIDGKDEIVGFDMAMAQHIADELGVKLEIKEMDFKNLIGSLSTGTVDMVIAGMSPDPERDVNFSNTYYDATHGVLISKDKSDLIKNEEDLIGKRLGAQMGSVQEDIANSIDGTEVKALPLTNNLIMELKIDNIDGIIMEKPVAESYGKANDDLLVVDAIDILSEDGEGSAIAMKKGNDTLTEKVNEILEDIKTKGLMDQWVIEANKLQEEAGLNN